MHHRHEEHAEHDAGRLDQRVDVVAIDRRVVREADRVGRQRVRNRRKPGDEGETGATVAVRSRSRAAPLSASSPWSRHWEDSACRLRRSSSGLALTDDANHDGAARYGAAIIMPMSR